MINKKNELINNLDQVVRWPKKPKDKEVVINFLSTKFDLNKKYTEKEVNNIIQNHHVFNDIPLLRRELISKKLLNRRQDGSFYWKVKASN